MPQSNYWPFNPRMALPEDGTSSMLQKQLGDMEGEVKEIQMELAAIRKDRLNMHSHKLPKSFAELEEKENSYYDSPVQEDHNTKFSELTKLREQLIRAKNNADEERCTREKYERRLKDMEHKLSMIAGTGEQMDVNIKEPRKHNDVEVSALKSQIRDLKEELEETRLSANETNEQLQEYRVKYLQAQQLVEELRRQLDVLDFDNKQVSDQIQIEIQKMKMQFQEKLQELSPLPDLLKGAQIQLQEAKQLQNLAEENSQQLSNELHRVKEKLVLAVNSLNQEKAEKAQAIEEYQHLNATFDEKQQEIDFITKELDDYKCKAMRLQEKYTQLETRFQEKSDECSELLKDMEELRLESNRAHSRNKDRADSMRRYLQTQISEIERQLIQSRAQCRACQKERDEIRQRMQIQINNLQENFELAEIRLRALQNQVASLKSTYTVILSGEDEGNEFHKITTA